MPALGQAIGRALEWVRECDRAWVLEGTWKGRTTVSIRLPSTFTTNLARRHRAAARDADLLQLFDHLPHLFQGPALRVDAQSQGRHASRASASALPDDRREVREGGFCRPPPLASSCHEERGRREGSSPRRSAARRCRSRRVGVHPRVQVSRAQDVLRYALDQGPSVPRRNR